jgi:hypothetical protein
MNTDLHGWGRLSELGNLEKNIDSIDGFTTLAPKRFSDDMYIEA